MTSNLLAPESQELPPVVLLVEDEPDVLDMYSTFFKAENVWIATASTPEEGLGAVEELRPDLVVTDIGFGGAPDGVQFVRQLKERADTVDIPLIVLTGLPVVDLPGTMRHSADLFLRKPVPPQALLLNVRRLLESSHALRVRSDRTRARMAHLVDQSNALVHQARNVARDVAALMARPARCPRCHRKLESVDRATVGGLEFEYYDWCLGGCGLYCRAVSSGEYTKLA